MAQIVIVLYILLTTAFKPFANPFDNNLQIGSLCGEWWILGVVVRCVYVCVGEGGGEMLCLWLCASCYSEGCIASLCREGGCVGTVLCAVALAKPLCI